MALIDKKFKVYRVNYFFQCVVAGIFVAVVLFGLGSAVKMDVLGAVGASSLGSSVCLVFMAPSSIMSKSWNILGGYFLGIMVGAICFYLGAVVRIYYPAMSLNSDMILFGAIAVAVTQLLMVIFDVEHSPAAGLAIGLVIEPWEYRSIVVIILCVVLLTIVRTLLRKRLISLI